MKQILAGAVALIAVLATPALSQTSNAEPAELTPAQQEQLLKEIKADKKNLVAENLKLSEAEASRFWPIYDAYQADLAKLNERTAKLIMRYADAYNANTLTDVLALELTDEQLSIEADEAAMRKTYAGKLVEVVSATTTARYLQIESKIRAILRYELAASIPLIP